MKAPIIPLFPLELVVFPGQVVPLHIFEERYKAMVAACRGGDGGAGNSPFGISFQGATLYRVGCSLEIGKILREYEDGRLDLFAVGKRRYRMLKLYNDRPYFTGSVEFFEDGEEAADQALAERVGELYGQLRTMGRGQGLADAGIAASTSNSFQIAQAANLELEQRQHLLEMTSENRRLEAVEDYLKQRLALFHEQLEAKKRREANGHPDPLN